MRNREFAWKYQSYLKLNFNASIVEAVHYMGTPRRTVHVTRPLTFGLAEPAELLLGSTCVIWLCSDESVRPQVAATINASSRCGFAPGPDMDVESTNLRNRDM